MQVRKAEHTVEKTRLLVAFSAWGSRNLTMTPLHLHTIVNAKKKWVTPENLKYSCAEFCVSKADAVFIFQFILKPWLGLRHVNQQRAQRPVSASRGYKNNMSTPFNTHTHIQDSHNLMWQLGLTNQHLAGNRKSQWKPVRVMNWTARL